MSATTAGASMGIRPLKVWTRRAALRDVKRGAVEPIEKWHIVRGDLVHILSGRDAGKSGRVKTVLRRTNRVIVEGCNLVKRQMRAGEDGGVGGVVPMPSPLHYSNVNLVDPTLK